jgi:XTP/dITP diphosphohydrolase
MKIVFASKNEGKVKEIKSMFEEMNIELVSLNDYKDVPQIVEDGKSFQENALKKARIISEFTGEIVLADDSGLQVDILKGEPGVYSSRYAGEQATDEENNKKLLTKLKNVPPEKRTACFICVLILYRINGSFNCYEGKWCGQIIDEGRGRNGFGYDPIFWLPEMNMTAAELPAEIKNKVSHRGQAFSQLRNSLLELSRKSNGA